MDDISIDGTRVYLSNQNYCSVQNSSGAFTITNLEARNLWIALGLYLNREEPLGYLVARQL